jgi:hypothetical protein
LKRESRSAIDPPIAYELEHFDHLRSGLMTRDEIREWLMDWLGDHLGISPEDVEMDRAFGSFGLDTEVLEALSSDIEDYFEERLDPGAVRVRSTVASLTRYLCELTGTDEEDDYESGALRGMEADNLLRDIGLQ